MSGAIGVQPGAANDFNKINWKTPRGSFLLLWQDGQAKSVDARNGRLGLPVGLGTPVGLVMNESSYNSAAGVMFEVSIDDQTYFKLYDGSGSRVEKSFTAEACIYLGANEFAAWDFIRVVLSDGSGNEVNSSGNKYGVLIVMRV
jgi:hypothetical protein